MYVHLYIYIYGYTYKARPWSTDEAPKPSNCKPVNKSAIPQQTVTVTDKREWGEEGGHRKPDQDEGVVGPNSQGGGVQKCKPKVQEPDSPYFPEFPPSETDFGAHN